MKSDVRRLIAAGFTALSISVPSAIAASFAASGHIAFAATLSGVGASAAPVASISPSLSSGLKSGQQIALHVGPNGFFKPGTGIEILECGDSGGQLSKLPQTDLYCDGNTVNQDTVIVGADGSFSEPSYTLEKTPWRPYEPADSIPKCDSTHICSLYIGEDQNDFSQPKIFSQPFLVGAKLASPANATNSTSTPVTASVVSLVVILLLTAWAFNKRSKKTSAGLPD